MNIMAICKVPDCSRTDRIAKGYCSKHYAQIKKHGRLTPELERDVIRSKPLLCGPVLPVPFSKCHVVGCNNPIWAVRATMCKEHHDQMVAVKKQKNLNKLCEYVEKYE